MANHGHKVHSAKPIVDDDAQGTDSWKSASATFMMLSALRSPPQETRRRLSRLPSLLCVLVLLVPTAVLPGVLVGSVIAIVDGDTIKVLDTEHIQHVIRLAGIDAPEMKMPFGQRSKQNLSELVYGKQVVVEGEKMDRYGRLVGKVLVKGYDTNLAQIQAGMAWHYKQYQRRTICA